MNSESNNYKNFGKEMGRVFSKIVGFTTTYYNATVSSITSIAEGFSEEATPSNTSKTDINECVDKELQEPHNSDTAEI